MHSHNAFVALATIITCHKFKLYDGTLVATLTGVAMISTVHDQYISSFIIRLATTSTGLIISSLVNLFVIPPKYSATIAQIIQDLFKESSDILNSRMDELVTPKSHDKKLNEKFQHLIKGIEKTERLCLYQKDEWKYHRFNRKEIRTFHYEYKKLVLLYEILSLHNLAEELYKIGCLEEKHQQLFNNG